MITTGQQIIDKYHELVDDDSRFSISQDVDNLNLVYIKLLSDYEWIWNRAKFVGSLAGGRVQLPTNFLTVCRVPDPNNRYKTGFYVGRNFYPILDQSADLTLQSNYGYIDEVTNELVAPLLSGQVSLYYRYLPDEFTVAGILTEQPLVPARFRPILAYLMAVDFYPIDGPEETDIKVARYTKYVEDYLAMMIRAQSANRLDNLG